MQRNNFTADKVWKKIKGILSTKFRQCQSVREEEREGERKSLQEKERFHHVDSGLVST